jgi:aminodeoxychorismate lyase
MKKYINLNGKIFQDSQNVINHNNRAFRYGDGIFESIRVANGNILNAELHYTRILNSLKTLKIDVLKSFNLDFLKEQILNLCDKNEITNAARVRLSIFRSSGGLYKPESSMMSFLIECAPLEKSHFCINEVGLSIGLYNEIVKTFSILSGLKSCNSQIYVLASIYAYENNFDDCLIINDKNNIIETTSSSLFLVKNNKLFTPSLEDGCVDGVMRKVIIDLATKLEYTVDTRSLSYKDIMEADEVFLTNAIVGIKWVFMFNGQKYDSKTSTFLLKKLNEKYSLL